MKKDIILSGVGGQGILSIATVIGQAATTAGLFLKQAEVHGMSQRGGDVHSNLRLSDSEIWSDLIPNGGADLIISMEPMEALRYLPYLKVDGWIITSCEPFVNINTYPDTNALLAELRALRNCRMLRIEDLAKQNLIPKGANMILLGLAAPYVGILTPQCLREAIATVFASKGERVVEANQQAFDLGFQHVQNHNL